MASVSWLHLKLQSQYRKRLVETSSKCDSRKMTSYYFHSSGSRSLTFRQYRNAKSIPRLRSHFPVKVKVKVYFTLDIAPLCSESPPQKRSGMAGDFTVLPARPYVHPQPETAIGGYRFCTPEVRFQFYGESHYVPYNAPQTRAVVSRRYGRQRADEVRERPVLDGIPADAESARPRPEAADEEVLPVECSDDRGR